MGYNSGKKKISIHGSKVMICTRKWTKDERMNERTNERTDKPESNKIK